MYSPSMEYRHYKSSKIWLINVGKKTAFCIPYWNLPDVTSKFYKIRTKFLKNQAKWHHLKCLCLYVQANKNLCYWKIVIMLKINIYYQRFIYYYTWSIFLLNIYEKFLFLLTNNSNVISSSENSYWCKLIEWR